MFGCIVAGRLVQTNLRQVDSTKWVFDLPEAHSINHIVVFLTGETPFPPGFAATVHFHWPSTYNLGAASWQCLGMLSNEKPSAVFKLSHKKSASEGPIEHGVAELGISIEPVESVMAQVSQLQSALVPAASSNSASSAVASVGEQGVMFLATKIVKNLFNYISSFSSTTLPPGSNLMQFVNIPPSAGGVVLPLKAIQDWYETLQRKIKMDPEGKFLLRED